jgi:uncharacterized protein YbjT (DUF2867 family)
MANGQIKIKDKTAIILGATGLTGGILLRQLLKDDRYIKIKLFSRTSIGFVHPKLEEYIGDLLELDNFRTNFTADEVFCCIGTTKAKTPDTEMYKKIDFGIPVSAAEISKLNGIDTFLAISAMGANSKSGITYNRIKGEMEEAVLNLGIPRTYILQPSLIGGDREEKRLGEWIAKQVMKVFNLVLVGPLEKFKSIDPELIAGSMVWLANNNYGIVRIQSHEIKKIYRSNF